MAKLQLGTVANLLGNPTSAATTINNNSALIITALENTLSRDGTTPNQMEADLDLNGNDILNVDTIGVENISYKGQTLAPPEFVVSGAMLRSQYDPTNVGRDVFDRRNWGEFNTNQEVALTNVPIAQTVISVGNGDGYRRLIKISTPSPARPWHIQSLDGSWWQIKMDWLTPQMFGAVADGVVDDYQTVQNCLDAAAATKSGVYIPDGVYLLSTGSPRVSSNTVIRGNGRDRSVLRQPNYYSYTRPGPYVRGNVVDWNALYCDTGVRNVEVYGVDLRGPFWQSSDADYISNPVQSWPASNGFHVRGADYEYRKSLPISGTESVNIRIHDCHFEGWAEDAVQTDMCTEVWVYNNTMYRNARGGHRGYSCVHAWTDFNSIDTLSPGDYLNNGNRMYGVEFTRSYIAGVRASADFWVTHNRIRNCLQWKGMGTHGGQRGNFLYNDVFDCHHGVGIDKGGFTVEDGISPPRDIKIIGNRFYRAAPGDPTEGNGEGGAGHAMFVVAHDTTDVQMGRNVVISDNICEGWGSENLNGGAWIGNWNGVSISNNIFRQSFGSAIRFRDKISGLVMGGNSFIGVTRSAGGNHRAIAFENAEAYGSVGVQYFENIDPVNTMTAIFLSNHSAGQGVSITDGHRYVGLFARSNIPINAVASPFTLSPAAAGFVNVAGGGPATGANSSGITSTAWESTGVVLVTCDRPATIANNLFAVVSIVGTAGRTANWERVGTNQIRVRTFTAGGSTPVDNSFSIVIYAF